MKQKEIHFYADSIGISVLKITAITHEDFKKCIEMGKKEIRTFSMVDLSLDWTREEFGGYRVFIHQNKKCIEIYPDMIIPISEKQVRYGHNIRNLWLGGAFDSFFYGNELWSRTTSVKVNSIILKRI